MLHAIAAGLAALSMISSPTVVDTGTITDTTPPPGHITIDVVTVNGSGCPDKTAAIAVSPDNTAFTITYSQYMAKVQGTNDTDSRKNCQVNLNVHVPQGFTYAIAAADYRGFANLKTGASAQERANYYFQGSSQTAYITHKVYAPIVDDWQFRDEVGIAALVYKPCGVERYLNINTELRVNAGTSDPKTTSFISMDSTDGSINTVYQFSWLRC
jgi:Domain of unknown function (DUF4360)